MKLPNPKPFCNPYVEKLTQNPNIFKEASLVQNVPNQAPICLEVGCAHGVMLRKVAEKYPEINFIGNDYKFKEVVVSAERCAHLKNVYLVKSRVQNLVSLLPLNYLSSLISFYPDPWPKRKQQKNRIWCKEFVTNLSPKLKMGAPVVLKTDQRDYFEQMLESFQDNEDFFLLLNGPYHPDAPVYDDVFKSFFEELFFKQQTHSYFLIAIKLK